MVRNSLFASAAGLVAALTIVVAVAGPAAASELFAPRATALEVTGGGRAEVAGLMPGDALATSTIEVGASGCLRYQLRAETTGTETTGTVALAEALQVTITLAASGELLYAGPLADAQFSAPAGASETGASDAGRSLCDTSEVLRIDGHLPLSAGNEVQGASLGVTWIVEAIEEIVAGAG